MSNVEATVFADTVFVDSLVIVQPDSVSFFVDEPAMNGAGMCSIDPPACRFEWQLEAQIALLHTVGPDGRLFVTAESTTEGVSIDVETLEWVPPGSPPWWSSRWNIGGVGLGVAAGGAVVISGGSVQDGMAAGAVGFFGTKLLSLAFRR